MSIKATMVRNMKSASSMLGLGMRYAVAYVEADIHRGKLGIKFLCIGRQIGNSYALSHPCADVET